MEVTAEKTNGAAGARICAHPECGKHLGPTNRSGRCGDHFHWGESRRKQAAGNGHAATRSNGVKVHAAESDGVVPAPANGRDGSSGRQDHVDAIAELAGKFREDRLNRLILGFPLADKAKMFAAWLRGEI